MLSRLASIGAASPMNCTRACSKLTALMDDAEADVPADMGFPTQQRAKIRSINPMECLHNEIKRHSDVVDTSSNELP
jgi:transposase-like protein